MQEKAQAVIARCRNLPTIPAIALEVLRMSREEEVDLRKIADVISRDVALSGRILSVVNSAFYGLPRKVSNVNQAVVMLGLASVKTLALGFSLAMNIMEKEESNRLDAFWRRSLYFAVAARSFAERKCPIIREEAFTAGLLADVGTLAMFEAFAEKYAKFCVTAGRNHVGILEAERKAFGTDHQEVGLCMVESWHLPELLTIPVAHHHEPNGCGEVEQMVADLGGVLYVANLCAETFCGDPGKASIESFESAAQAVLGIDQATCRALVENLHTNAEEVARLLDIKIPEATSYTQVVQQANEELTRLTLASQQQVHKIEETHRQAATRVQELEESNRQLSQKANTDPLTGVYNRRFMEGFLDREIARHTRFRRPLSVLFIDVDHFKKINDRYGHHAGDEVLQRVAQLLRAATREVDCLCRYGGEEFVLTLLETEMWGASQVAEKIRRLIASWAFECEGQTDAIHVTVSIGVASMNPNRPVDKGLLIQMADESAYAAKNDGRNCVCAMRRRVSPLAPSETVAAN
jgi:diguanylate cyclase (GGDEF)-like protein